jgi:hypothetical protein
MAQKCVHQGCGKTYTDEDEVCRYHPGPPIFHEGQKGKRVSAYPVHFQVLQAGRRERACCSRPLPRLAGRLVLSVNAKLTTTSAAQDGSAASRASSPLRSS